MPTDEARQKRIETRSKRGLRLIMFGLLVALIFDISAAFTAHDAGGKANSAAERATAAQVKADSVVRALRGVVIRDCEQRSRNVKNASHRGDVIQEDLLEVDRPFLLKAAAVRHAAAIVQQGQGRTIEANLNESAAVDWVKRAKQAKKLANSIKPYEEPNCALLKQTLNRALQGNNSKGLNSKAGP